jgi:multiple sugar transport system ATP-binding protein
MSGSNSSTEARAREGDQRADSGRTPPSVELRGVTKEYTDVVAVKDLDLRIREGELMCFLGPSGSGKTTTLNLFTGIEQPTDGDVLIDGEVVNDVSAKARDVTLVFQNLALFDRLTVRQNLGFAPDVRGEPEDVVRERVRDVAEIVNLPEEKLDQSIGSLTPSERQRVAIGRAIVSDPSILLLDEPMSNLDADEAIDMRGEVKTLQEELGQTAVYVTHDQEEAMSLADRIMVIHQGELQQLGTPRELYERPANRFVAGFIGSPSMNFVEASRSTDGIEIGDATVSRDNLEAAFDEFDLDAFDKRITVGIRPETLHVDQGGDQAFTATVADVESLGAETILYLQVDGQELTLLSDRRLQVDPDDDVAVGFDIEDLYPIDPEDGSVIY